MKPTILDSSSLFSLASLSDTNHKKAVALFTLLIKKNRTFILPTEVFAELLNIAGKKGGREMQIKIFQSVKDSENIIFPHTTKPLINLAYEKLTTFSLSVSFTDALVMSYADHYHTKEILGFDSVFEKSGYILPS